MIDIFSVRKVSDYFIYLFVFPSCFITLYVFLAITLSIFKEMSPQFHTVPMA